MTFINFTLSKVTLFKNQFNNSFKKTFYFTPSSFKTQFKLASTNSAVSMNQTKPIISSLLKSGFTTNSTFNNSIVMYLITNYNSSTLLNFSLFYFLNNSVKLGLIYVLDTFKRTIGDGFIYIRGLFIIFFIDACLTDDEPI